MSRSRSLSLSLSLSLFLLSLSLSLPCVLSEPCNACSPNPCSGRCITLDCRALCSTEPESRAFDMFLRSTPASCPMGDMSCYANYVNFILATVTMTAMIKDNCQIPTPQQQDTQGIWFQGAANFWGLTGTKIPTSIDAADKFLLSLQPRVACAQWSGGDCPITYSVDDPTADLYINISSVRKIPAPTILSLTTCPDGTLIDATTQSCPINMDPVFMTSANTNNNNNRTTQLLMIILPIVGGSIVLMIASIIAIRRYRSKQVNAMMELPTTSPTTQV